MGNCRKLEFRGGRNLQIWEHENLVDEKTGKSQTGSWVWDCALVLAFWLDTPVWPPNCMEGKRVVELGAGTGLAGLAAALLGAEVVLTDRQPLLKGLQRNVKENGLESSVIVKQLEWGQDSSSLSPPVDYVLLSDVLYDIEDVPALCKTLLDLSDKDTQILLSYELRLGTTECFKLMLDNGLRWSRVPTEELHPDWQSEDIGIFRVWR